MADLGDIAFGAVVLVVFLALVAVAGVILYRVKNARFARAWAPLVPLVNGRVRGDGGGSSTSFLHGTYAGRAVVAATSPMAGQQGRVGGVGTGMAANFFELAVVDARGRQDWTVRFDPRGGWQVEAADASLTQRLAASELIPRIATLGEPGPAISTVGLPVLAFAARSGELRFREDAGSAWVPEPARFAYELQTLIAIAELTEALNR